jgi:methionyl-tRNA synthetase
MPLLAAPEAMRESTATVGQSYYVTTPIYYVNAAPHLGHAYTTIAADVLARHHRQRGDDVFFLTGTDEHGEPVALAAEAQGLTPQALVDRNAPHFEALAPRLDAAPDFFIRTTDAPHKAAVQEILTRIKENGYVYKGLYEGWYCPRCADFKAESEIADGTTCPVHKTALLRESEENWFFRLSAFQSQLESLFATQADFVAPHARYNEALAFIRSGLRDISLSRAKLTWGVRVPWDPEQVFYVWFDALLNYYTALGYADGEDLERRFWPASLHLIGKDILKFHAVYWPAMLLAAGLELPEQMFVHGFLLMDGEKMSKSLGNVLDPVDAVERFGADALRFYLLRDVTFGGDGSVSTAAFEQRYESELANELGNLASRSIAMALRYRNGDVSACEFELADEFDGLVDSVCDCFDAVDLTGALAAVWQRVRRLNRYIEQTKPWDLAKCPERSGELDAILATLIGRLGSLAVLLEPFMPSAMAALLDALGAPSADLAYARRSSGPGAAVCALSPLFPKR